MLPSLCRGSMGRHMGWLLLLAIVFALLSISAAKDTIVPGDVVQDDDFLVSANGRFSMGFFTPGRSKFRYLGIWYSTVPVQTVVWVANRDRPLIDSTGVLSIFGNGSLVLSDSKGTVYWSTGSASDVINPVATLLNDSNFVVTSSGAMGASLRGGPVWQSFDYPTDTLMSGMKIGWDLRSGRNHNLTSWRSADDPAPGEYFLVIGTPEDPQVFLLEKKVRIWRSGPWIGKQFSGVPVPTNSLRCRFNLLRSADEVYVGYDALDGSLLTRAVVQPTGEADYMVWNEKAQAWTRFWFAPRDRCDTMSTCGTFGLCDVTSEPQICSCVRGFVPCSPQNWDMGDSSDGCMRRAPVDCRNGTDRFVPLSGVKLPDTTEASVDHAMGLEQCRLACLRNCSCTGYANSEVTGAGGRGCILWTGNLTDLRSSAEGGPDLFVRVAAADLGEPAHPRYSYFLLKNTQCFLNKVIKVL
ncbi:hypothetical protein Taro_001520 [Colocasia esculenta]|uniref:Uncharacterized protein n=1 Tax=Colocasia esculenta TaxID=4460 RepID=A0A843TB50_COLES|nr:hypothetical protein [Colocasia esculenta]